MIARLRRDDGFSLVEVTIASTLFLVIITAALTMLDSAGKNERLSQARYDAQLQIRQTVEQFSRDVRQATSIDSSSNCYDLKFKTLVDGVEYWEEYNVSPAETDCMPTAGSIIQRRICSTPATGTDPSCLSSATPQQIGKQIQANAPISGSAQPNFCYQYDDPNCNATSMSSLQALGPNYSVSSIRVDFNMTPVIFGSSDVEFASDIELRNLNNS